MMYKINPGGIDLFKACFGKEGILGELVSVIDKRVKEVFENRVRMSLSPVELPEEDNQANVKSNMITKKLVKKTYKS